MRDTQERIKLRSSFFLALLSTANDLSIQSPTPSSPRPRGRAPATPRTSRARAHDRHHLLGRDDFPTIEHTRDRNLITSTGLGAVFKIPSIGDAITMSLPSPLATTMNS